MKLEIVRARAKRNKFIELAGIFYQDNKSLLVSSLTNEDDEVYFGISNKEGLYTIIGRKNLYYSTMAGSKKKISNSIILEILKENALKVGKGGEFEFIEVNNSDSIWVLNGPMMCAIWNILLLFKDNSPAVTTQK